MRATWTSSPVLAAAVRMLLRFFGFGVLAFDVRERHVQRFVTDSDTDGVHRHASARALDSKVENLLRESAA
jgi:hypothetical protein